MSSPLTVKPNLVGWSPYVKVYDPLKVGSIDGTDLIPHDNAVIRAISAEYIPPDKRSVQSNPSNTLFVGRLNLRTSENQLREEFSKFGPVRSCRVVEDIATGISRGYGFIEFKREADAQKAWRQAHGTIFQERQILVEWEFSRTMPGWVPRRLGGGLGGRKESGQLRFGGRDRPFKRPFILPPEEDIGDSESYHKSVDCSERLKTFDEGRKFTSSRNEYEKINQHRNNFDEDRGKHRRNIEDYPHCEGNRRWHSKSSDVRSQDQYSSAESRRTYRKEMNDEQSGHYYSHEDRKHRKYTSNNHSKFEDSKTGSLEEKKSCHSQSDNSKRKYNKNYDDENYGSWCDGIDERIPKKMKEEHTSGRKGCGEYFQHKSSHVDAASFYNLKYEEKNRSNKSHAREKEERYKFDTSDFNLKKSDFRDDSQNQQGTSKTQEIFHKRKHQRRDSTDSSQSDGFKTKKKQKKSKHKRKRDHSESISSDSSKRKNYSRSHKKKSKKKRKEKSSRSSPE